jgi:cytochrome c-type biogenesis protein CcmH
MRRLVLTALIPLVISASYGEAQQAKRDPALEAKVRDVASQLRCPVCQGLSLQDSPSELSQEMKDVVRDQLQAGKSPEEVKRYFIAKYGEWILLQPKATGFNVAVYVLPILALLGGVAVIVFAVRKWTAGAPSDLPADSAGEDEGAEDSYTVSGKP